MHSGSCVCSPPLTHTHPSRPPHDCRPWQFQPDGYVFDLAVRPPSCHLDLLTDYLGLRYADVLLQRSTVDTAAAARGAAAASAEGEAAEVGPLGVVARRCVSAAERGAITARLGQLLEGGAADGYAGYTAALAELYSAGLITWGELAACSAAATAKAAEEAAAAAAGAAPAKGSSEEQLGGCHSCWVKYVNSCCGWFPASPLTACAQCRCAVPVHVGMVAAAVAQHTGCLLTCVVTWLQIWQRCMPSSRSQGHLQLRLLVTSPPPAAQPPAPPAPPGTLRNATGRQQPSNWQQTAPGEALADSRSNAADGLLASNKREGGGYAGCRASRRWCDHLQPLLHVLRPPPPHILGSNKVAAHLPVFSHVISRPVI